jgi:hypothetical protein
VPHPALVGFTKFVVANPILVCGVTLVASLSITAFERRRIRLERSAFFRGWQSLGQPFARVLVSFSMILVGLLFLAFSLYFASKYASIIDAMWNYLHQLLPIALSGPKWLGGASQPNS